ncbi:retinol dehydrogenase 13-like [Manduca sexta]|uniref:RDH13 n=1 Tax=Manduca sexta TaxID=7130 RepID=A0A921ZWX5_MANSE|nr:retinol dehydrogenase 13-like [Manduca sexta]KAG6465598.1 hypothetical protein O3G_MSEX015259 [Manduca sexta]
MFVIFVVAVVLIALIAGVYQKNTNAICTSKKRLDGKTVLVTGGTTGMGLEIAIDMASRGARTIIACPFEDEGIRAKKLIIEKSDNNNVVFKHLDLGCLMSVKNFAKDILETEERLDILLNNAGVGILGDFSTKDGLNFIMQVNYFGTFQLTLLLLPLLKKTGQVSEPSRIVNTASILHWIGVMDFDCMNKVGHYFKVRIYGNSKLCVVYFTRELAKRLQGSNVVVNSVDPGAVGTKILESGNKILGMFLRYYFFLLFKTPWQGAQTALHVALDKDAGTLSGKFFRNCQISRAAWWAYDDKVAKKLWDESLRLVKLNESDVEAWLKN